MIDRIKENVDGNSLVRLHDLWRQTVDSDHRRIREKKSGDWLKQLGISFVSRENQDSLNIHGEMAYGVSRVGERAGNSYIIRKSGTCVLDLPIVTTANDS